MRPTKERPTSRRHRPPPPAVVGVTGGGLGEGIEVIGGQQVGPQEGVDGGEGKFHIGRQHQMGTHLASSSREERGQREDDECRGKGDLEKEYFTNDFKKLKYFFEKFIINIKFTNK